MKTVSTFADIDNLVSKTHKPYSVCLRSLSELLMLCKLFTDNMDSINARNIVYWEGYIKTGRINEIFDEAEKWIFEGEQYKLFSVERYAESGLGLFFGAGISNGNGVIFIPNIFAVELL